MAPNSPRPRIFEIHRSTFRSILSSEMSNERKITALRKYVETQRDTSEYDPLQRMVTHLSYCRNLSDVARLPYKIAHE